MFYLFHYNKTGKISSLYKGTMCLRMFHRCCIVSPLIRRMAGLGISFHILVLYVSLLIHQIPEVEHLQEFPKPGCHLDFFGKWKKNSLQQFGKQLDIFGNLAKSSHSTRIYARAEQLGIPAFWRRRDSRRALPRARGNTLLLHFDWPADGIGNTLLLAELIR